MAAEAKIKNTGFAEAFNFTQLPGSGLFVPTGCWGPPVASQLTVIESLRNNLISNNRAVISQAYAEIGLVETIVDLPVDDAFSGGLDIKTKELDESDLEELHLAMEEKRDVETASRTCKWDRLYGGAGTIILDGTDPKTPFNIDAIQQGDGSVDFKAADLWELYSDFWVGDDQDVPNIKRIESQIRSEYFSYYGERIHRSRVMIVVGKIAPSLIRQRLRGYGLSVLETLIRSINQYLKATSLGFEVLDEFKLDIYKISGLVNTLMAQGGQEAVQNRIAVANAQKNYNNAIVLDGDDDYESKQLSFAGLADAMQGIRTQVSSDMRIPQTKLFGTSAQGFSSGEEDMQTYNQMIESTIRSRYKFHYRKMVLIRCQEMFGFVPDDLSVHWKPLRVLKATDEETVKTQKYQRLLQARTAGEITTKEFRDGCNKANLLDIRLDTDDGVIAALEREKQEAPQGEGKEPVRAVSSESKKNALGMEVPVTSLSATRKRRIMQKFPWLRKQLKNSDEYDLSSYEGDGGDNWIDPGRESFFDNPLGVSPGLWAQARQKSVDVYGEYHWQYAAWLYRRMGGVYT